MTAGPIAIVLAGGTSRRFGSDKLRHRLGERTLLAEALSGLPADTEVIVVGPSPPEHPELRAVREEPAGGGPAAALVAGLRAALAEEFEAVLVLPGDAPQAGHAAAELLSRLRRSPGSDAVLAMDSQGREQPLQLALRPAAARALFRAAGENAGSGASARLLVRTLTPPPLVHQLSGPATFDIDTPAQLHAWLLRESAAVDRILSAVREVSGSVRPVVVALDGPSAAGKSTLAAALALRTSAVVLPGDDFYSGDLSSISSAERDGWTGAQVMAAVFDWARLREEALQPLSQGGDAVYLPYDWTAGDGRLGRPRRLAGKPLVLLEGVYSARPELADLIDLSVYVDTDLERRVSRDDARGDDPGWRRFWERGEQFYFDRVRPPASFDLRVRPE